MIIRVPLCPLPFILDATARQLTSLVLLATTITWPQNYAIAPICAWQHVASMPIKNSLEFNHWRRSDFNDSKNGKNANS
jgi:hypothetical protein